MVFRCSRERAGARPVLAVLLLSREPEARLDEQPEREHAAERARRRYRKRDTTAAHHTSRALAPRGPTRSLGLE
jgi:hypothetical protein